MEYLFVHDKQGGWWLKIDSVDYDNFCRRDELIFPNFQISDIRIKQFDKGQHYYAYVGDMQVRDGDVLKWNTYDEAYTRACALVGGE